MKKTLFFLCISLLLSGCSSLSRQERIELNHLTAQGVTIDKPVGNYEKPANPIVAGLLNLLPGVGNFYLASGNAAQSSHAVYGLVNLLFWPLSIAWGVPEATIDANNINQREMLYYYKYDELGKKDAEQHKIHVQ